MSEVILVTATCANCDGRLKGWHYDHQPADSGEYAHLTHGVNNPFQHEPYPKVAQVADYHLWHTLEGLGW